MKNRRIKRLLSGLLAAGMLFAMQVSVPALASGDNPLSEEAEENEEDSEYVESSEILTEERSDVSAEEAADRLYGMGLLRGVGTDEDGKPIYELERTPTRAEALTMFVRLIGKERTALAGAWSTPFTDVPEWAAGYVGYAYDAGLTKGVSPDRFDSDSPVTAEQYLTFLLRALAYTEGTDFVWDQAHLLSDRIGLTDSAFDVQAGFTRGDAVLLSYRALSCRLSSGELTLAAVAFNTEHTGLPQIFINAGGGELTKEYLDCLVSVSSGEESRSFSDAAAQVKVRGNNSAKRPKKPYRIKFDSKMPMLGLNDGLKAKSWVLLAEYSDRSMLRNSTAFFLGEKILGADGYYVSDCCYVNLFIDGEYEGVYLLAEQQQVNKHRVNVTEPDKDDPRTDIGYLIEMDRYFDSEDPGITFRLRTSLPDDIETRKKAAVGYVIQSDIYSADQRNHIKKVMQNIWDIMRRASCYGEYYTLDANGNLIPDPDATSPEDCISKVVDLNSLADMFLLQELVENMDVSWSSFFFSIDLSENGNHKLTFEAPWDFDWSLGQGEYRENALWSSTRGTVGRDYNPWLHIVAGQEWFLKLAGERWNALEQSELIPQTCARISELTDTYGIAFACNFDRWPECMEYDAEFVSAKVSSLPTQEENAEWVAEFLRTREAFLNSLFNPTKAE